MGVSGSGSCRGEVAGCTQSVGAPALAWGSRQGTGEFGETEAGSHWGEQVDKVRGPVLYVSGHLSWEDWGSLSTKFL